MSKITKLFAVLGVLLLGVSVFVGAGASVYAAEEISNKEIVTDEADLIQKKLSPEEVEELVNELAASYPTLTKEYLRDGVYKQMRGDYTLEPQGIMTRTVWQGITVDQMGAAIDTAIGIALGGAVGGLVAAMKKSGKHAAKTAVKSAMIKYGLIGGLITESVIDFVLNLASPGHYLAKYWDQRDKVPNNGRINF